MVRNSWKAKQHVAAQWKDGWQLWKSTSEGLVGCILACPMGVYAAGQSGCWTSGCHSLLLQCSSSIDACMAVKDDTVAVERCIGVIVDVPCCPANIQGVDGSKDGRDAERESESHALAARCACMSCCLNNERCTCESCRLCSVLSSWLVTCCKRSTRAVFLASKYCVWCIRNCTCVVMGTGKVGDRGQLSRGLHG